MLIGWLRIKNVAWHKVLLLGIHKYMFYYHFLKKMAFKNQLYFQKFKIVVLTFLKKPNV